MISLAPRPLAARSPLVAARRSLVARCAAISLLAGCSSANTPPAAPPPVTPCTFTNPIDNGADPWVIRQNGTYYSVESAAGGITVYRSNTLTRPKQNGVRVWTPPDTGWNRTNVWAPELHLIDGRWYIYYTAGRAGPPFTSQRSGVLESATADPQGAYIPTADDCLDSTGRRNTSCRL